MTITLQFDPSNSDDLSKAQDLVQHLRELNGKSSTEHKSSFLALQKKAEAESKKPEAESENYPSVQEVREAMNPKVEEHHSSLKEKLDVLGAKNISTLKPEDRQEFIDFANAL